MRDIDYDTTTSNKWKFHQNLYVTTIEIKTLYMISHTHFQGYYHFLSFSLSFLFHWKFRWAGNSSNLCGSRFLMQNRTVWDWSTTTAFIASWERERERERESGSKEGWEFYNIIIIVSVLMQMVTYMFLNFWVGGVFLGGLHLDSLS